MIESLLGALGAGSGGSFLGPLLNVGFQLLPGLFGGRQSSVNQRSILRLQNMREELSAERAKTDLMRQARTSIGTARALLSSSGFSGTVGSMAETIPAQSMANLGADIGMINLSKDIANTTREMRTKLNELRESQRMNPLQSQLFQTIGSPLMSSGFKNLGSLIGAF